MTDIIGRLLDEAEKAQRKGHLVLAEVCRDASDQLGLVINERDGAKALIDRMHAQDALVIQAWKKANPGHGLRWPGRVSLSAWCLGEIANLEAERDRLRKALYPFAEAVDSLDEDHPDHYAISKSPAAMGINGGDLRKARAALGGRDA